MNVSVENCGFRGGLKLIVAKGNASVGEMVERSNI